MQYTLFSYSKSKKIIASATPSVTDMSGVHSSTTSLTGREPSRESLQANPRFDFIISQFNPDVANPLLNAVNMIREMDKAHKAGKKVILFPELSITGYNCLDEFYNEKLLKEADAALDLVIEASKKLGIAVITGFPRKNKKITIGGKNARNSMIVFVPSQVKEYVQIPHDCTTEYKGGTAYFQDKVFLPTYKEQREYNYYEPGDVNKIRAITIGNQRVCFHVCEDGWDPKKGESAAVIDLIYRDDTYRQAFEVEKADIVVNISGSPYSLGKTFNLTTDVFGKSASAYSTSAEKTEKTGRNRIVYTNLVGLQEGAFFSGGSFIVNDRGEMTSLLNIGEKDEIELDFSQTNVETNHKHTASTRLGHERKGAKGPLRSLARMTELEGVIGSVFYDYSRKAGMIDRDDLRLEPTLRTLFDDPKHITKQLESAGKELRRKKKWDGFVLQASSQNPSSIRNALALVWILKKKPEIASLPITLLVDPGMNAELKAYIKSLGVDVKTHSKSLFEFSRGSFGKRKMAAIDTTDASDVILGGVPSRADITVFGSLTKTTLIKLFDHMKPEGLDLSLSRDVTAANPQVRLNQKVTDAILKSCMRNGRNFEAIIETSYPIYMGYSFADRHLHPQDSLKEAQFIAHVKKVATQVNASMTVLSPVNPKAILMLSGYSPSRLDQMREKTKDISEMVEEAYQRLLHPAAKETPLSERSIRYVNQLAKKNALFALLYTADMRKKCFEEAGLSVVEEINSFNTDRVLVALKHVTLMRIRAEAQLLGAIDDPKIMETVAPYIKDRLKEKFSGHMVTISDEEAIYLVYTDKDLYTTVCEKIKASTIETICQNAIIREIWDPPEKRGRYCAALRETFKTDPQSLVRVLPDYELLRQVAASNPVLLERVKPKIEFPFTICQFNPYPANPKLNAIRMIEKMREAAQSGSKFIIFGEEAIPGYNCKDEFYNPGLYKECEEAWEMVMKAAQHLQIAVVAGTVKLNTEKAMKPARNCLRLYVPTGVDGIYIPDGGSLYEQDKIHLPTYREFREYNYFEMGDVTHILPVMIGGKKWCFHICEDGWDPKKILPIAEALYPEDTYEQAKAMGAQGIINLSASPPYVGKTAKVTIDLFKKASAHYQVPIVYTNVTGWQEGEYFSGGSFIVTPTRSKGAEVKSVLRFAREDQVTMDLNALHKKPGEDEFYTKRLSTNKQVRHETRMKEMLGFMGGFLQDIAKKEGIITAHDLDIDVKRLEGCFDSTQAVGNYLLSAQRSLRKDAKSGFVLELPAIVTSTKKVDIYSSNTVIAALILRRSFPNIPIQIITEGSVSGSFLALFQKLKIPLVSKRASLLQHAKDSNMMALDTYDMTDIAVGKTPASSDLATSLPRRAHLSLFSSLTKTNLFHLYEYLQKTDPILAKHKLDVWEETKSRQKGYDKILKAVMKNGRDYGAVIDATYEHYMGYRQGEKPSGLIDRFRLALRKREYIGILKRQAEMITGNIGAYSLQRPTASLKLTKYAPSKFTHVTENTRKVRGMVDQALRERGF